MAAQAQPDLVDGAIEGRVRQAALAPGVRQALVPADQIDEPRQIVRQRAPEVAEIERQVGLRIVGLGVRTSWGPDGTDFSVRNRIRAEITFRQLLRQIRDLNKPSGPAAP
mgnify:CR=1 FL=1